MYQVKINDGNEYNVGKVGEKITINERDIEADIRQLSPSTYHVISDLKSYNVELVNLNAEAKTAEIKINGHTYAVTAKDQYDILLEKLGLSDLNHLKISNIKAPMPGLVLKVFITPGSEVKKGDNLFILEAMKMENIIKSPADATVRFVKIKPGDKVEKNQVLIEF
ncbi:MAG TPA: biotin/lipoyl-containing protein [Mucilaginibacter sp.]|nr:biotin/lipoyl-containing protein [Mucilaginibacter sp.]